MESTNMMVSIIVPVYNVEDYVDECINSLINQTYTNLEIICVDDSSLDSSYEICKRLESTDSRIKVYRNSSNQGLGSTRNNGVEMSHGDYLFFVDSDDWLSYDAIEKQLNKLLQEGSDVCIGTVSNFNQATGEYTDNWRIVDEEYALKTYLNWAMFNKLYKAKFYKENNFKQYAGIYEDAATWPIMMKIASKVSVLKEVTYFYRCMTGKSIMDKWENSLRTRGAIEYMVSGFKERNYSTHDRCLYEAAFALARGSLGRIKNAVKAGKCQMEVYDNFKVEMEDCLADLFPDYKYGKTRALGSVNLNKIFRNLVLEYKPSEINTPIYNFSSVISLMSDFALPVDTDFYHEKKFRQNMVKKDWLKLFWQNNYPEMKYLLIDFIDERYDILEKNGCYYTRSEAFEETYIDEVIEPYSIIDRMSKQCNKLWKAQCEKFIEKINAVSPDCKIILIELYLTEYYVSNDKKTRWKNQQYITNINDILKDYYSFVKNNAKNLIVITIPAEELYTDESIAYGCYPWNYNINLYTKLTEKVREIIDR